MNILTSTMRGLLKSEVGILEDGNMLTVAGRG